MIINTEFNIGDYVYLIHDPKKINPTVYFVTGVKYINKAIGYVITSGEREITAPEYELRLHEENNN